MNIHAADIPHTKAQRRKGNPKVFFLCAFAPLRESWMGLSISCAILWLCSSVVFAQLPRPRLHSVFPLGGQAGQKTQVVIQGEDLDSADKLLFSHPGISAAQVMKEPDRFYPDPRPENGKFTVAIAPDVPPGVYEIRAVGVFGVSNARRFVVGSQPEIIEKEPNNALSEAMELPLNAVANGRCDEAGYDCYRFTAKAGQRLIVHCVSRRLNSQAEAAFVVTDASGKELARSARTPLQDAMSDFTAPADGDYVVKVHDFVFEGSDSGPHGYRLTITDGPWIDYMDPPMVQAGATQTFTLYGRNLPNAAPAVGITANGAPLQKTTVTVQAPADGALSPRPMDFLATASGAAMDVWPYRLSPQHALSGVVPLGLTDGPVTYELEPNDTPQQAQPLYPPFDLVGRFGSRGDNDWLGFDAKKGQTLALELFSQRVGVESDPTILVQRIVPGAEGKPVGQDIQEVDDAVPFNGDKNSSLHRYPLETADAAWLFTAPEDGAYRVLVRDQFGSSRGDAQRVYRLVVRPPKDDFRLVAFPFQSPLVVPKRIKVEDQDVEINLLPVATVLRRGQTEPVALAVIRPPGSNATVRVTAEGLPPGITAEPVEVPPWKTHAVIALHAAADAAPWAGPIRLVGRTKTSEGNEIERPARAAETIEDVPGDKRVETQLVSAFNISVTDDFVAPVALQVEKPATITVARGGKVELPVKLIKQGAFKGGIVLKPMSLGPEMSVPDVGLNEQTTAATATLNIGANAPLGTFSFYLHGLVTAPFQHNLKAAAQAQQDLQRIAQLHAELQQSLPQVTDPELKKIADEDFKLLDEAKKKAEAEAKRLADGAAPRDVAIPVSTPTITVTVTEK